MPPAVSWWPGLPKPHACNVLARLAVLTCPDVQLRHIHAVFLLVVAGEPLVQLGNQERKTVDVPEYIPGFCHLHGPCLVVRRVQPLQQLPRLLHCQLPTAFRTAGSELVDAAVTGLVIHADTVEGDVQGFKLLGADRFCWQSFSWLITYYILPNILPPLPARCHSSLSDR